MPAINARPRIMVIDDNRDTRQLLNDTLRTAGFDTVAVAESATTPTLLDRIEPVLVILDATAPGDANLGELDRLRKHTDVPIIMLAANYDMESLRRAFSLGADDYVHKPFERRSFLARIRAKLRRAGGYSRTPSGWSGAPTAAGR